MHWLCCCCSVAQSCVTLCDLMNCSTPGFPVLHHPGACPNSCPLSPWYHPTLSSSVIPFSSCLQSFPASGSFPMSQFFASGDQRIGASASVFPVNIQGWFPLRLTGLTSCCPRDSQESSPTSQLKASVLQCSAFFIFQLVLLLNYFFHSVASQFVRPQNSANLD